MWQMFVCVVVVLFALPEGPVPVRDVKVKWHIIESASKTPARFHAAGAVIDQKVYVISGTNQSSLCTNAIDVLDIKEDKWSKIEDPSDSALIPVSQASAAACGDRIFVFGGKEDMSTATFAMSVFDTRTGTWVSHRHLYPTPEAIFGHTLIAVKHKYSRNTKFVGLADRRALLEKENGAVVTGVARNRLGTSLNIEHSYLQLEENLQHSDDNCDLYVIGGRVTGFLSLLNSDTWAFDSVSRQWRHVMHHKTKPAPRTNHAAVAVKALIFVFGGDVGSMVQANSAECWILNTAENEWSQCGNIGNSPPALVGATAAAIAHIVYVFGGYNGHRVVDTVYAYNMDEFRWLSVESITPPRWKLHPRAFHLALTVSTRIFLENDEENEKPKLTNWQQIVSDDSTKHVILVTGGSGFYDRSPIYADTWVMQAIVN